MTIGSRFKNGKIEKYFFDLTPDEYERLLMGEEIIKRTGSAYYEDAMFILTFKGIIR